MGSTSTKTVKGKKYLYFVYFEDGQKYEKYCGPEGEKVTEKLLVNMQIAYLKRQRDRIMAEIKKLEGRK